MKKVISLMVMFFAVGTTSADQWLPPRPITYQSDEGKFRLTVFPRRLRGALPYFEDKVEGKEPAGQSPIGQARCEAVMEKLVEDHYEQVWRRPLVNDVAPVDALVSGTDGSFITFDNWHSTGTGNDVIVIYSGSGKLRRKFKLTDIMSNQEIERLPTSVSSIHWSGDHYLDYSDSLIVNLQVLVGESYERNGIQREFRTVKVRLDTAEIEK